MYKIIQSKLRSIIKQAFYKDVDLDTTAYPRGKAQANEKVTTFTRMSVYGVYSNPPINSHILLLSSQGQESNKFGFLNDFLNRKKNLKSGEVAVGNTSNNMLIVFKDGVAIGNEILPMISTPPKTGVDALEILDRLMVIFEGTINLGGVASQATLLSSVIIEIGKLRADLASIKGEL